MTDESSPGLSDPRRRLQATAIASVVIYACAVGVPCADPTPLAKAWQTDRPFGLPIAAVIGAVVTVLYAPFPFVFFHAFGLVGAAQARGAFPVGVIGWARLLASVETPEERRSRAVVLGGLAWFVAIVGAWIAYAASRGV